jgi:Zn-dependent peptidase ImmA (M78 family)
MEGDADPRDGLAGKLKTARSLAGLSTRAASLKLADRFATSHATIANYEGGRTAPPMDVLTALAELYGRPLNWFLERGRVLSGFQYRKLKSRVREMDKRLFEAEVQQWVDAYVNLEARLHRPLGQSAPRIIAEPDVAPEELSHRVRRDLRLEDDEPVASVVDVLERHGIRVLENRTELRIDGLAAKCDGEFVVVLNPMVSNERTRLNAAHELAHIAYGDCGTEETESKAKEARAFEFASHLLIPKDQLKRAFDRLSLVRLIRFKERFGISLSAMVYQARRIGVITGPTAKMLWMDMGRRGWRTKEPGEVGADRATRFEQLLDDALSSGELSLKELADMAGVRPEAIRERLNQAMGI